MSTFALPAAEVLDLLGEHGPRSLQAAQGALFVFELVLNDWVYNKRAVEAAIDEECMNILKHIAALSRAATGSANLGIGRLPGHVANEVICYRELTN